MDEGRARSTSSLTRWWLLLSGGAAGTAAAHTLSTVAGTGTCPPSPLTVRRGGARAGPGARPAVPPTLSIVRRMRRPRPPFCVLPVCRLPVPLLVARAYGGAGRGARAGAWPPFPVVSSVPCRDGLPCFLQRFLVCVGGVGHPGGTVVHPTAPSWRRGCCAVGRGGGSAGVFVSFGLASAAALVVFVLALFVLVLLERLVWDGGRGGGGACTESEGRR
jgi:hypothetical protein